MSEAATGPSPWVRDVTEETFEAEVLAASDDTPVVVDFWSPSCAPCRTLGPLLERLVDERAGKVLLAKVNVDGAPRLAEYFGIAAIPAIKVIYRRQLVHEFEGLLPEPALRQFLDEIAPLEEIGHELRQAAAAEATDPAAAAALYRQVIAGEPNRLEARVGLARVLLRQGQLDEVPALLEPVGSEGELGAQADALLAQAELLRNAEGLPDVAALRQRVAADATDAQARLQLGTALAGRGEFEPALEALLAAAELDLKLATGPAREEMVKVFYALGSNHPLSNEYRSRLARLLY